MSAIDQRLQSLESVLRLAPVVPVVVIEHLRHAVPLARALVAGGLPVIEITLRTPIALEAVRTIIAEVDGAVVGVGTVRTPDDFAAAERAGARFAVSPGSTSSLIAAAAQSTLPWLPGAATASEVMALAEYGHALQKFFPAHAAGGVPMLRAFAGPLADVRFCATGGIEAGNARDYLALSNVLCVGGSWCTPAKHIAAGDWNAVQALAREAAALRPDRARLAAGLA
jgi:2-dehydro-3-deoxyphosphogluconate aldolase/(4S)-4-hydroxy-2-oxoglutarate aldolase